MKKIIKFYSLIIVLVTVSVFCLNVNAATYGYNEAAINKIRQIQQTYPVGSKFTGSFEGAIQCKGFAGYVYNQMFGLSLPAYTANKVTLYHTNVNVVGEITWHPSVAELKNMFSKGRTGDIIQGRKQSSQHTMVFMYATDEGIHVYDCNSDGNLTVKERDLLYSEIAGSGYYTGYIYGISLYTAPNYDEKYGTSDTAPPVISNARVIASDNNGYMLECNVTDNTAVSYVQCATWTLENGQDDIQWTNMVNTGENTWKLYISYADHGNQKNVAYGNDIYAYDTSGNGIYVSVVFNDWSPPLITDYKIVGVDSNGYMLQCNVADDSQVSSVRCATWTSANGHDDIQWTDMVKTGENIWKLYISFADHGNEMDQYCNDIYAYDSLNQGTYVSVGYNRKLNIGDDFYAIVKNIGYKTVLTNLTGNDNYYITGESSVQNAEQLWRFQINSNNEYTIKSVIDGQAMEIYGGASADGSRPNVLTFNNTDAQKWYISNNISGYNIVPKCAVGKTLQTHANGTIDIYSIESNKDSQAFEISILKNSEISSFYPQINEVKFYNTNSYTNTSTQFSEGDTIYMKNSFKNIPGFDMSIYKDNQLISSQHINKLNEEVSISNVKSGNYKVVLKGENQLNSIEKTAAFSVVNKSVTPTAKPTDIPSGKVTTKTKITAYEKKYILNTQVSNLHEKGAHIIFAAYDKNNTMIDIIDKIYDGNDLVTEFKDNSNISYVKIFVWRNYSTITPLTENIEYITFR